MLNFNKGPAGVDVALAPLPPGRGFRSKKHNPPGRKKYIRKCDVRSGGGGGGTGEGSSMEGNNKRKSWYFVFVYAI